MSAFRLIVLCLISAPVFSKDEAEDSAWLSINHSKDALQQRGEQNVLMWLVAPQIPNSVREFLDRIGIEYSEIHEAQFRKVAERHGIKFESQETSGSDAVAVVRRHPARSSEVSRRPPGPECPDALKQDFD